MKMYSGEKSKANAAHCASKPENPNRKEDDGIRKIRSNWNVVKTGFFLAYFLN